jgi:competence protein ComGC
MKAMKPSSFANRLRTIRCSEFPAPRSPFQDAFTRAEALVLLAIVSLLVVIVLPALAHDRARSSRIQCANNLRQVWVALQLWGGDHQDQLLWNASIADGGTRLHPLSANAWFHYAYLSNELNSARVLFCPSDTGTPAEDFTGNPAHGYLHPNFRNRATSYFLDAHPSPAALWTFSTGEEILIGDRNVPTGTADQCNVFTTASGIPVCPIRANYGWLAGLHGLNAGNLLTPDGRVEFADDAQLRQSLESACGDDGNRRAHFCMPR